MCVCECALKWRIDSPCSIFLIWLTITVRVNQRHISLLLCLSLSRSSSFFPPSFSFYEDYSIVWLNGSVYEGCCITVTRDGCGIWACWDYQWCVLHCTCVFSNMALSIQGCRLLCEVQGHVPIHWPLHWQFVWQNARSIFFYLFLLFDLCAGGFVAVLAIFTIPPCDPHKYTQMCTQKHVHPLVRTSFQNQWKSFSTFFVVVVVSNRATDLKDCNKKLAIGNLDTPFYLRSILKTEKQ